MILLVSYTTFYKKDSEATKKLLIAMLITWLKKMSLWLFKLISYPLISLAKWKIAVIELLGSSPNFNY